MSDLREPWPPLRFRRLLRSRRRMRRPLPPIALLPTLMTLGNLICGFAAIHYAAKPVGETAIFGWSALTVAGALIFVGMFFDAVDGSVARLTRTTSDLGGQLDSLSDLVTFGVAPAFMMLRLVSQYVGPTSSSAVMILGPEADNAWARVVWGVAAVYVACTALRLARFNVETPSHDEDSHRFFRGLPSPGAGGTVASLILLHENLIRRFLDAEPASVDRWTALGVPLVTLLCAVAMVSTLRYAHLINRYLRGGLGFTTVVRIVVPLFLLIWWFQFSLAFFFTAYALSGPIRWVWVVLRRGRSNTTGVFATVPGASHRATTGAEGGTGPADLPGSSEHSRRG
jgi:CDP-diacylglycerol--serine O-phosphatidyltransferase